MTSCAGGAPNTAVQADLLGEVAALVDALARKLRRLKRRTVQDADLTPSQYAVLGMLWERDGRALGALADACCCSRSTITGVIDTMERKGLVRREDNPTDRRSLLVRLSDAGKALERAAPSLGDIYGGCCAGITPEELDQLRRLLGKLNDTIRD